MPIPDNPAPEREKRYMEMFSCDTARISRFPGKIFLIIGKKRSTCNDEGQWYKNGKPFSFGYVEEKCIASGRNEMELLESALEYKRLCGLTIEQYIQEQLGKNPAAVALSKMGASKGGMARALSLSSRRRKQIAKKAANARWSKEPTR